MKIFPKSTETSQLQTHKFYVRIKFIAFTIRPTIKRPLFEASVVLAFAQDSFSPSAVSHLDATPRKRLWFIIRRRSHQMRRVCAEMDVFSQGSLVGPGPGRVPQPR